MVTVKQRLCASSILGSAILFSLAAAPSVAAAQAQPAPSGAVEEVVVTGSRIRTTDTTTPAPVNVVSAQVLEDRGFTQVGQALNESPSITPSFPRNTGIGNAVANVQTYPNLFNLGAGRTLSLINGRRAVTTSSGLEDAAVDANIIPIGLLDRVDVVQAGGAAVYGSGAIAGVINYVLKRNFEGMTVDAQYSITSKGDYPIYSFRGTVGHNFLDGRANIAANVDYSKSDSLLFTDRTRSAEVPFPGTNPANRTATDGIPATVYFINTKTWSSSYQGMFWANTGNTAASLLQVNGRPVGFDNAGTSLVPYDTGQIVFSNLAVGGGGVDYNSKSSLFAGIERFAGTVIGSYDLTPDIRLSTELLFSRTRSTDPRARSRPMQFDNTGAAAGGTFSFEIFRNNAYLTPTALAQLSAASPAFAAGTAPLYLGKFFDDLLPNTNVTTETQTWRALAAVDGKFEALNRNFDWFASFMAANVQYEISGWNLNQQRLRNSVNAVRNSAGQIVCAINVTTVVDPNCVPMNIFGVGNISEAARQYVIVQSGQNQGGTVPEYSNDQTDFLLGLGGDVIQLPAGMAKFNVTYEHRSEQVNSVPLEADRLGLVGAQTPTVAVNGKYNTNELAGELLVPVIGRDMNVPLVQQLELNGSYRYVDNSLAGKETVYGLGLRWNVGYGLTIRSSLSRNFRAPNLNQLIQPATAAVSTATNPCSNTQILSGSNPAARQANCLALFTANPTYGATTANPAGSSAAARLAGFNDIGNNFRRVLVTTSGNPNLENETSKTLTYGLIFQPDYVPGLTLTIDRIQLDLRNALSAFSATSFIATCFDSTQRVDLCNTFTFASDGTLATGTSTTYNAGFLKYHGTIYNLNYRFDLGRMFGQDADLGMVTLGVEGTNNTMRVSSVTGLDLTRTHHTTQQPFWVVKPTVQWARGPLRVNYTMFYLPSEPINYTDTVENASILPVKANIRHNLSGEYKFSRYAVRFGVNNLTDEEPSFPYSAGYGDIIGRQYFLGLKANF